MKLLKLYLALLYINISIVTLKSQDTKIYTKVAYGNYTMDEFFQAKSNVLPSTFSRSNIKSKGAIFISFNHPISERISAGASLGSTKITSEIASFSQPDGLMNRNLYTLAIESDFIYFKRQNYQLYGVAGYGYTLGRDEYFTANGQTGKGSVGFMAFQLNPIAFKYGNKIALFAELGFGYKGIINFGFMYGF